MAGIIIDMLRRRHVAVTVCSQNDKLGYERPKANQLHLYIPFYR